MNDIVIDTNVLLHTNNKGNHYNKSANESLKLILQADLFLCVDDVFSIDSAKNTSVIGHEYNKHIRTGTFAYAFLLDRFKKCKIKQIIKKDYRTIKHDLNKMIINKKMNNTYDIAFIIAAHGSQDKMLISNDKEDLINNRNYFQKKYYIIIYDSDEYVISYKSNTIPT